MTSAANVRVFYVSAGYRTFVLDVPAEPDEMRHIGAAFGAAADSLAA